jgi:chloramphenicol-sensitive protein RarD
MAAGFLGRVEREVAKAPMADRMAGVTNARGGVLAAVTAFLLWGLLPVYWKALDFLAPGEIVAQRTVWSLLLLVGLLAVRGRLGGVRVALATPHMALWHLLSGSLLAGNWLLYVWATLNGRILEGALGYYLNPFFNMLFGLMWFGERYNRRQMLAILLALGGVALQMPGGTGVPWVALTLALSFSLYAVVRKRAPLGSADGLAVETALLALPALGWLAWCAGRAGGVAQAGLFGTSPGQAALVVASGLATALPLLCFAAAARRIRLSTLGILQFIGPSLQFGIGWKLYGEPMPAARFAGFGLIWLAVGLYAVDALRSQGTRKDKRAG